jgi:high-affinity Fe2+/Pb2+ permease
MTERAESSHNAQPLLAALAWFAAPTAWAGHLGLVYSLAGWACEQDARWMLYAITLAALLLAAVGVLASRRVAGGPARPFLGRSGFWLSILFLLVILVQTIPILIVESCR